MVDVLRVFLSSAHELCRPGIVAHRQHANEIGEEHVGRLLHVGIFVQVIVQIPAFVAHPQIVVARLHDVGKHHEVGGHDLVHVPQRVERVQLVIGRPALEVPALVEQQAGGRVQPLAEMLHHAGGGIAGEKIHRRVRILLAHGARDSDVALDVTEADRTREEEDLAAPALCGPRRRSALGGDRDHPRVDGTREHEIPDEPVDLRRLSSGQRMSAPLEGDDAGARNGLCDLLADPVGDDAITRPVQHERGHANLF